MTTKRIAVLPGDGIGPEVMESALEVLKIISLKYNFPLEFNHSLVGGAAFEVYKSHFPDVTKDLCSKSDAILFGSVGGATSELHLPKWINCETNSILALRKEFGFAINLRPIKLLPSLSYLSPLKDSIVKDGLDILFVRELLGDVYFGEHRIFSDKNGQVSFDSGTYTEEQCRQAITSAFNSSKKRSKKVTLVHKANVLSMSKLWISIGKEIAALFPEIQYEEILVDNFAMQLIINPNRFDVVVTSNLFGDILSDLGSAIPGTLGLSPSASLSYSGFAMYEPAGGSAPDIAGKNTANPSAQILSGAMMLEHSFNRIDLSEIIKNAVFKTLDERILTADLKGNASTKEFTKEVISRL